MLWQWVNLIEVFNAMPNQNLNLNLDCESMYLSLRSQLNLQSTQIEINENIEHVLM